MSEQKRTFNISDLASFQTRNTGLVDAPEIGPDVQVRVRGMMAGEYLEASQVQAGIEAGKPEDVIGIEFMFGLFRTCVVDDDGDQVFRDAPANIAGTFPVSLLMRVVSKVMELSEMNTSDLPADVRVKVETALKEASEAGIDPDAGKGSTGDSGNSVSG